MNKKILDKAFMWFDIDEVKEGSKWYIYTAKHTFKLWHAGVYILEEDKWDEDKSYFDWYIEEGEYLNLENELIGFFNFHKLKVKEVEVVY